MIDRHELEKMFDEFDGNIILMSPSHYKEFVNRFLDYHYTVNVTETKANPIRGERGDFLKVTITLPPDMLADLNRLGIERKLDGMRDTDVSSLIREALTTFLEQRMIK